MSLTKQGTTILDGLTVGAGGTPFFPADDDSSFATYERDGHRVGVTYELGDDHHYLRFAPDYQLPEHARSRDAWNRFVFEMQNDDALFLKIDFRDGEVRYFYNKTPLNTMEEIEEGIECGLDLVTSVYADVVRYVAEQLTR